MLTDGELFAVDDRCSHADVSLSEGEVEGCLIECWLHGSQFDLRTGQPTCLPANAPWPRSASRCPARARTPESSSTSDPVFHLTAPLPDESDMSTLDIRNLHVSVVTDAGSKPILRGIDLTVESGQTHAIMGPNGSGKSTLAYSIAATLAMRSPRAPSPWTAPTCSTCRWTSARGRVFS